MNNKIKIINPLLFKGVSHSLAIVLHEISQHISLFPNGISFKFLDPIAARDNRLDYLKPIINKTIKKPNQLAISVPFNSEILYGRKSIFDNNVVAGKCWSALSATIDWVSTSQKRQKEIKSQEGLRQLFFNKLSTNRQSNVIKGWHPRNTMNLRYLPHNGIDSSLPKNTPERAVASFLNHWCDKQFPFIGGMMLYPTEISMGEKAYKAKLDFDHLALTSFNILSIEDQTANLTQVVVALNFQVAEQIISKKVSIRVVCQDSSNDLGNKSLMGAGPNGNWKIMQSSLSTILFSTEL